MTLVENSQISFFTATILNWQHLLNDDKYKEIIVSSMDFLVANKRVTIYAFVIMPNHIHLLWKILEPYKLKDVQRDFLKYTGQMIRFDLIKNNPDILEKYYVGAKDRKYQFWERNAFVNYPDSREMVEVKMDYIHNNPVQGKWMLGESPLDYKYSSARFYEIGESEFKFLSHYMEMFE